MNFSCYELLYVVFQSSIHTLIDLRVVYIIRSDNSISSLGIIEHTIFVRKRDTIGVIKMKISVALSFLLAKAASATMASNNGREKPMLKSRIPSTGEEWISLKDGVEFQPAMNHEDPEVSKAVEQARLRFLAQKSEGETSAYETQFVDGSETYYAILSQAWRYIGFFVDCNGYTRDNRKLEDAAAAEEGVSSCGRYLLWAAVSIRKLCSYCVGWAGVANSNVESLAVPVFVFYCLHEYSHCPYYHYTISLLPPVR